jgi:hypothetical protein
VVRAAQNRLLALARVAQVTGDPAGPVLVSQIALLTPQYRLFEETKQALSDVRQPAAVFTDRQVENNWLWVLTGVGDSATQEAVGCKDGN